MYWGRTYSNPCSRLSEFSSSIWRRFIFSVSEASFALRFSTIPFISSTVPSCEIIRSLMHFSIYCCSVLESRLREILSKNSSAFSRGSRSYFSFPIRSYNRAPDSVIYNDSSLADFKLCSLELILKSRILVESSSSTLATVMALYNISAIFNISLTAKLRAS